MEPRAGDLAAEGFVRCTLMPSALAHWMWSVELVSEQDRRLRVVDETVLRLVEVGIADPDRIAALMGVDESEIVPSSVANLMRAGALKHDAGIQITSGGRSALARVALREPVREGVQLHFDPYVGTAVFAGARGKFLSSSDMRARGLHQLPIPPPPNQRDLFAKHLQIQSALEHSLRSKGESGAVDVLRMIPRGEPEVVFEEVHLELWQRPTDHTWRWRLLRDADESVASKVLRTLEEEGADVLPFVPQCDDSATSETDGLLAGIFAGSAPAAENAQSDAMASATTVAAVLPPYPAGYAELATLLQITELDEATAAKTRVTFGGSSSMAPRAPDPLRGVAELLRRHRIGVSNLDGALHHGALLCDDQAFVMRYHVATVSGRRDSGVPWVEVRIVPDPLSSKLREFLAPAIGTAWGG